MFLNCSEYKASGNWVGMGEGINVFCILNSQSDCNYKRFKVVVFSVIINVYFIMYICLKEQLVILQLVAAGTKQYRFTLIKISL